MRSPVEIQKIIWNKGFDEMTMEDMYRCGNKWDLICNADKHIIHVCEAEEIRNLDSNWKCIENAKMILKIINK